MTLDRRRMFTRRDLWRAWQLQDRKCKLCGRALDGDQQQLLREALDEVEIAS